MIITETTIAQDIIDLKALEKLRGGSGRTVYRDGDKVFKVAKNAKGLEQNILANDYYLINEGIFPNLIEVGLDFIITEYIPRNDKATRQFLKPLKQFSPQDFDKKTSELQEVLTKLHLRSFMNYNILWNDITAYRNWGTRPNGIHVLIDEGAISDQIHCRSTPAEWAVKEWEQIKRLRRK